MRGLSFKALIVGNILNPVLLLAATLALMSVAAAVLQKPGESYLTSLQALDHAQGFLFAVAVAALAMVVFVGYVTASLSSQSLALNAALSTTVLLVWNFVLLFRPSTGPNNWLLTGLTWAMPLFAALGGYARARQVSRGSGPIRWKLGVRFALAIVAALLAGLIVFALLARVAPVVAISSAILTSLIVGYAIAPSEKRTLAAWTMLSLAALVAVWIFLGAAFTGTLKFFDYFLLLSVATAAIIGRTVLKPTKGAGSSAPIQPKRTEPDKIQIQAAPRTDPSSRHLWMRPQQQRDSSEKDS